MSRLARLRALAHPRSLVHPRVLLLIRHMYVGMICCSHWPVSVTSLGPAAGRARPMCSANPDQVFTVSLTGVPGSGQSTIGGALAHYSMNQALRAYIIAEYRHIAMSDGKMIIGGIGISSKKLLNLAQTIVPKTIARPIAVPITIASVAAASSTLKLQ